METKHTPLNWKQDNAEPRAIYSPNDGKIIAMCDNPFRPAYEAEANAEFIVLACNSFAALTEQNAKLKEALQLSEVLRKGKFIGTFATFDALEKIRVALHSDQP